MIDPNERFREEMLAAAERRRAFADRLGAVGGQLLEIFSKITTVVSKGFASVAGLRTGDLKPSPDHEARRKPSGPV